ncbi:MAG: hypothetical protein Q7J31_03770 [Syntrophales bacterium]|nr:hypothetical protein [Syntrophales bacterium]
MANILNLDKNRNSLSKYCYDLSKIIVTIAIINPVVTKALEVTEIISGIIAAILFLGIAMLLEKGD